MKLHKLSCKLCNKTFETKVKSQKFCSTICKYNAIRKDTEKRYCLQCNKPFKCLITKTKKFCSRSCSTTYQMSNMTKEQLLQKEEKRSNTLKRKYGVDQLSHNKKFIEKTKITKLKRYGISYYNNTEKRKETNRKNKWEFLKQYNLADPEFQYSSYKNCTEIYEWKCTVCKFVYKSSLNKVSPRNCPNCAMNKAEKEIYVFLKEETPYRIQVHNRKAIYPKEIDLYIPEVKIGIEYNGLYWHQDNPKRHIDKYLLAKEKKILLIQIFEDEWLFKKDIVKSRLLHALNKTRNTIYARKCIIKAVDKSTKKHFLDKNHLQGNDKSTTAFGLYYNDKLISIMTFGKSRISTGQKNNFIELMRFCSELNTNVIGGFGKLLAYYKNNFNPSTIITFSDNRWGTGNVYLKNGFIQSSEGTPNYFYFKTQTRYHRFGFRKSILKKRLKLYDSNLTEKENMKLNGYSIIWDAGSSKFYINL